MRRLREVLALRLGGTLQWSTPESRPYRFEPALRHDENTQGRTATIGIVGGPSLMRTLATFLVWTAIGVVAGAGLLVTAPRLAGVTPFTILSGSMTPAYGVGDVVLDERVAPLTVRPGDVVTFTDPTRQGATLTHRVRRMWRDGATVHFETRGDANNASETWDVAATGSIGRVRMRVPRVGIVLTWAHSREGKLGLIAIPAALLALIELCGAVRRPRAEATPA